MPQQDNQEKEQETPEAQVRLADPVQVTHNWRQRGNELYCTSCPAEHRSILPNGVRLIGFEANGMPKFERCS